MSEVKFEIGQRVITPNGEGEIKSINGDRVQVQLEDGKTAEFTKDKLSDDSDAG